MKKVEAPNRSRTYQGGEIIFYDGRYVLTEAQYRKDTNYHLYDMETRSEYLIDIFKPKDFIIDYDDFICLMDIDAIIKMAWCQQLY